MYLFYSLKQHVEDVNMKNIHIQKANNKTTLSKFNAKSGHIANTIGSIHAKSTFIQHSYQM